VSGELLEGTSQLGSGGFRPTPAERPESRPAPVGGGCKSSGRRPSDTGRGVRKPVATGAGARSASAGGVRVDGG
jgi:hypothetical protein